MAYQRSRGGIRDGLGYAGSLIYGCLDSIVAAVAVRHVKAWKFPSVDLKRLRQGYNGYCTIRIACLSTQELLYVLLSGF
jgi:hypothetical protein